MTENARLLLLHEIGPLRDERVKQLRSRGWDVIAADHQDLWWPKFIETTRWEAIVIDASSYDLINAEVASELGSSPANQDTPLYLMLDAPLAQGSLPTPLKRARQGIDYDAIIPAFNQ